MKNKICKNCWKVFTKWKNESVKYFLKKKYCSHKCYCNEWFTDEHKKKMSFSRIGILSPWSKEWLQSFYKKMSWKNHPWWKWWKTSEAMKIRKSKEYKLWRTAVFERDDYTCIWCNQRWWKLNADHIKPFALFPELRLVIDNWRTLCECCHRTTDTFWRKKNQYITW